MKVEGKTVKLVCNCFAEPQLIWRKDNEKL